MAVKHVNFKMHSGHSLYRAFCLLFLTESLFVAIFWFASLIFFYLGFFKWIICSVTDNFKQRLIIWVSFLCACARQGWRPEGHERLVISSQEIRYSLMWMKGCSQGCLTQSHWKIIWYWVSKCSLLCFHVTGGLVWELWHTHLIHMVVLFWVRDISESRINPFLWQKTEG